MWKSENLIIYYIFNGQPNGKKLVMTQLNNFCQCLRYIKKNQMIDS